MLFVERTPKSGFLDRNAPSLDAEYSRYYDHDILGKILFKNVALNVLGRKESQIRIPLSRHGDVGAKRCIADAEVYFGERWLSVEIKCSHIRTAHRGRAKPLQRWSFSRLTHTGIRRPKFPFDLLFAVGINELGFDDPKYWEHLYETHGNSRGFDITSRPHEPSFLNRCGFFVMPFGEIRAKYFHPTIAAISSRREAQFFAWGYDPRRIANLWREALQTVRSQVQVSSQIAAEVRRASK